LARQWGYRRAIVLMFLGFFVTLFTAYGVPRDHVSLIRWMGAVGFFSGVFGLFTMYLPALFPTLLRSSGAGFSFNIGRIAAAIGTVVFGLFSPVGDFRRTLLCDSLLLAMAMVLALFLPDVKDGRG
jgi:MFS family permease